MKKSIISFVIASILFMSGAYAQRKATVKCPEISMVGPLNNKIPEGETAIFKVVMLKKFEKQGLLFNWSVNNGTIESGQGTNAIIVSTRGLAGQVIAVSVQIIGLDKKCEQNKSVSVDVTENGPHQ
jgi:hypothetical protein